MASVRACNDEENEKRRNSIHEGLPSKDPWRTHDHRTRHFLRMRSSVNTVRFTFENSAAITENDYITSRSLLHRITDSNPFDHVHIRTRTHSRKRNWERVEENVKKKHTLLQLVANLERATFGSLHDLYVIRNNNIYRTASIASPFSLVVSEGKICIAVSAIYLYHRCEIPRYRDVEMLSTASFSTSVFTALSNSSHFTHPDWITCAGNFRARAIEFTRDRPLAEGDFLLDRSRRGTRARRTHDQHWSDARNLPSGEPGARRSLARARPKIAEGRRGVREVWPTRANGGAFFWLTSGNRVHDPGLRPRPRAIWGERGGNKFVQQYDKYTLMEEEEKRSHSDFGTRLFPPSKHKAEHLSRHVIDVYM